MAQAFQSSDFKRSKFKDLKVYASTEWLADNKKRYRQVFDRYDISYVYAELSFHNKLFDVEDWEVEMELRCYSMKKGKKELCVLPFVRKVSKHDSVVYLREGWGNKSEGSFWKKGTYYWEAYIEGEKVGSRYFYVEDAGRDFVTDENNYLDVKSLRLYEGPYDDVPEEERVYYKTFDCEETRYIYLEAVLTNLNQIKAWHCEVFVKFYNDARELKGQVVRLQRVEKREDEIIITAGWGSNVKGSWRNDRYTAELVFMERVMAIVPFDASSMFEEGIAEALAPGKLSAQAGAPESDTHRTFEEVMTDLNQLIGLEAIKKQVRDHASYIRFLQLRKEKGFEEKEAINVHSVFTGNPGTGKTTVAGMMGRLYHKMGLLSKGHVHQVDRVDLVGEYIGQTAPKVKEAIEQARGGILFVDEAYSLARSNDDTKDFGREVIEILVREMSNGPGDLVVIVAGYPKEMKYFMDSNPGLKSRFKLSFEFADYLPQELSRIAAHACQEKGVELTPEANQVIDELITSAYRDRDRSFGNARFVHDLIERAKISLGLRVMSSKAPHQAEAELLSRITIEDVKLLQAVAKRELPHIPVDERALNETLAELDSLIGMGNIKEQIQEMVRLVRYYRLTGKDVLNNFSLHTVLVGNPGTGKTTVARILTKLYKALGMLERGQMVETDRQGLVAGYVGQTAIKTAEKIEEAMGGVLFIDEAYALTQNPSGAHGDFGGEAIQTLLKRMEDNRGRFFIFVAGYPDNMEGFLKANPGFNSRFDKILKFEDYKPAELAEIALLMFKDEGLQPTPAATEHLAKYWAFMHEFRDKYFGNARAVRSVVLDVLKAHNLRLAALPPDVQESIDPHELTVEDLAALRFSHTDDVFTRSAIGFRHGAR